jgi:ribosome-associated protein
MTGTSRPHVKALFNELHVRLKAAGELHSKAEGVELGWWVLMDYHDVVVHILQPEAREYYALDHLYQECPALDWHAVEPAELPTPKAAKLAE